MAAPTENVDDEASLCIVECTVATGFEQTAREEVVEKLGVQVKSSRGKISIKAPISFVPRILRLGTIDNCRVVIKQIRGFGFPENEAASLQKIRELVQDIDWTSGIAVWSQVFSFDHPIDASHENASGNVGTSETKDKETLPQKSKDKKSKKKGRGKDRKKNEKEKRGKTDSNLQSPDEGTENIENKSGASPMMEATPPDETNAEIQETPEAESQNQGLHENQFVVDDDLPESDKCMDAVEEETVTSEIDPLSPIKEEREVEAAGLCSADETVKSPTKTDEETDPPSKTEDLTETKESPANDPSKPTFRVTCNRVGEHHKFDSTNMAANFGGAIYSYFGWGVDLKNFDIEVILNIEWDEVNVCIGLTKESLHKRLLTKFGMTTLRPTIAYNMLRLCEIQFGDVVCDPMCGTGSIPISACVSWPRAVHLCGEIYSKALEKTYDNLTNLNAKKQSNNRRLLDLDIYQWDVTNLPLRDGSVDVFITDLPFGRKFGNRHGNQKLYPLVLDEMARVTRKDTGRACFITEDKRCMTKLIQESRVWQRRKVLSINMGGIDTGVYVLHRTNEDVSNVTEETPEVTLQKRKERTVAQEESKRKILEEMKKLSGGGGGAKKEGNDTKNKDSGDQATFRTKTTECSSQVSETNLVAVTSSQTLESGSPIKHVKIDSTESESQTTEKTDDEFKSSTAEGSVETCTETRSQMTETSVTTTADIGSQVQNNSLVTTETGIQAESQGMNSVQIKTRSQSSGTSPCVTDVRSQSTDTMKVTAETGSQATTTRNTSTCTSALPLKTASTVTESSIPVESGVQVLQLKTLKVDSGLQVDPHDASVSTKPDTESQGCRKTVKAAEAESRTDPQASETVIPLSKGSTQPGINAQSEVLSSQIEILKATSFQEKENSIPLSEDNSSPLNVNSQDESNKSAQENSASCLAMVRDNRLSEIENSDLKNDSYVDVKLPESEFASCVDTGVPNEVSEEVNTDVPAGDKQTDISSGAASKSDKEKGCIVM